MLKLFYCSAVSTDHDWVEIIVAETLEEAKKEFAEMVENGSGWYAGEYVHELTFDDYEVTIKKKS